MTKSHKKIICKDCGILINTIKNRNRQGFLTLNMIYVLNVKINEKNIFRKSASLRLSLNNPMFNKTYVEQMRKNKKGTIY